MRTRLLVEAEREFLEAIRYYERIEPGLGLRFIGEVQAVLAWIGVNATRPRLRTPGYRRVNLRVFPYFIAYAVNDETIWILAIGHAYRRPEFWLGRRPPVS